ncbi:MAG TPA: hypothetical protein VNJ04_02810 [Gemmatimonadaceae bacterium]|nr:hypothetical protein [Gemmatimonadaceae bacterium]
MANYGPTNIIIKVDDADGMLRTMTPYILSINDVSIEAVMEETNAFGDAWRESLATGVRFMSDINLGGLFDDVALGPDIVFSGVASGPSATTRTFEITYGGTKVTSVETLIQKYSRKPDRNALTKFDATLRPTGIVVET